MNPMIRKLILNRFRSIASEEVTFDNPTFVVGRNGSGKSNFVDAIAILSEAMVSPLSGVFERRGGLAALRNRTPGQKPQNLGLAVEFGPLAEGMTAAHYAFEVKAEKNHGFRVVREQCVVRWRNEEAWFDRTPRTFKSSVRHLKPALEKNALGLPVVSDEASFALVMEALAAMRVYRIQPAQMRQMQDPDDGHTLRADGSNVASVLQEIAARSPKDLERLEQLLAAFVPQMKSVRPVRHGQQLTLSFTQEWGNTQRLKFEASDASEGTLRALGLLTALFQYSIPSLIVIKEPETTMDPEAIGAMTDLLRHAGKIAQLVVPTHNPDILDAEWIEDRHIRIADWQEGATRLTPVSVGTQQTLREHMYSAGELLRSNALRGEVVNVDSPTQPNLFVERAA